ncbi:glycosyltransferase family 4 protein [Actinokineospora sp. NBRC 105648]|uniref:glycosyltransferase family 4 protein n=1 Tax=Actinokineospora sp. NBRC 105648 TaxID=3032206 RepID=UPI0024A39273|nr:glycosyltransferase family 4 protein [Actinokineospora sp. NBRC 105648]GLZ37896.1 sucrose-phosphate synthase [Actinokineospora sp. NBRC 105648]
MAETPMTVAFVLASYTSDAPAGMERATAALALGLRQLGHRAIIITAVRTPSDDEPDEDLIVLDSLRVTFPADDDELRSAITRSEKSIAADLRALFRRHQVDVAVYVDGLWGLGRIAPQSRARSVLAMHVLGHAEDLTPALHRADVVIAPSTTVLEQARANAYDTVGWQVVPNALLGDHQRRAGARRAQLRGVGSVRILARLGPEKNVPALLEAGHVIERPIEVVLAEAGFEHATGSQLAEWHRCAQAAANLHFATVRPGGLPWHRVPPWLANAAAVIVPSLKETFGLVALEAMSVGTPVIAFDVGNLPTLIGNGLGGVIVPHFHGEYGLWNATQRLLADPVRYTALSRAAYYRSRDYLPTTVAQTFLKAVR